MKNIDKQGSFLICDLVNLTIVHYLFFRIPYKLGKRYDDVVQKIFNSRASQRKVTYEGNWEISIQSGNHSGEG